MLSAPVARTSLSELAEFGHSASCEGPQEPPAHAILAARTKGLARRSHLTAVHVLTIRAKHANRWLRGSIEHEFGTSR